MGKVLCVCAHQDDDAFVVSRLRKHKFSGDEIRVVFTTLSLQNGDEYKNRRMNEARKAAELLGTARVDFLGFPDGQSYKYIRQIVLSLRDLISEYKPGIIYVNAFEGGHIDHDTANFCIAKAVQDKAISIFEFLLYNGYKRGLLPFRLRSFLPETSVQVTKLSDEEYSFVKDY